METLYHASDLVYRTPKDGLTQNGVALPDVIDAGWYWMNNRDTCYTVVVNAEYNTYTGVLNENGDGNGQEDATETDTWQNVNKTVSNNALNSNGEKVKAFPGKWMDGNPTIEFAEKSREVYQGASSGQTGYGPKGSQLIAAIAETESLSADDYVGYFTNTQGGIYLAYKQLADSAATTYTEELSNGVISTVARIPAAIIMSDGGANFSFNEMGIVAGSDNGAAQWNSRYGQQDPDKEMPPDNAPEWYISDDSWNFNNWPSDLSKDLQTPIAQADRSHRLGGCDTETEQKGDEWYKVFLPGKDTLGADWKGLHGIFNIGADYYKDGTLTTQPAWNHAGVLYSSDTELGATAGAVMEVLLTASYMNYVVKQHYANGWQANDAAPDSQIPLSTYTMNVDTAHVPQWGRWRLYPTLDPKGHPLDGITDIDGTGWNNNLKELGETYGGAAWGSEGTTFAVDYKAFPNLKITWEAWKKGRTDAAMGGLGQQRGAIDVLPAGHTYTAGGSDSVTVNNQNVIDNIAYNDGFYDIQSKALDETFDTILGLILGNVFVPVSGDNDAGVGDSITYQDPIGEYMEIKNGSINATPHHIEGSSIEETEQTYDMALLLFGEMHGLVRTGVYDFQWNDEWISENLPGQQGSAAMTEGWYLGDDPKTAKSGGPGAFPEGPDVEKTYTNANDARADGWVYRLNFKTVQQYVPILKETDAPSDLPDQVKNTVYTLYRFAGEATDRNELRRNPIYGEGIPADYTKAWQEYFDTNGKYPENIKDVSAIDTKEYPGIYRLSDIRVWVEETGDFVDEDGRITPNTGYDRALYVNIPAAAIPTELATITMGKDGVLSYETNLGKDHTTGTQITVEENGEKVTRPVTEDEYKNFCYTQRRKHLHGINWQ